MYPVNPTFVDNYDPRIVYADPSTARQGNKLSPRAHELVDTIPDVYENTLSITAEPTMSFQFIFYGRILQMYGAAFPWLTGQQPWAQYTIDDDGETQPVLSAPYPLANFSLYVSALLPLTFHTLTVKVVNASVDGPFLFDYIAYGFLDASEDPNPPTSSSSSASSQAPPTSSLSPSSSSLPVSSSATSAAGSSTAASAPTATVTAVAATSFPTGAVIGTVVGGVVLLAVVMLASLCVWRRMSKRRNVDGDRESIEPASDPGPPADIGPAVGVTRGEKGAPSSPHPRYARHTVSSADRTVQHSSWTSRDSSERWPYAPGSSSVHRPASPLTLREKAGMSVVESEPRSSAAYQSRPSSWDILSDGRGGSTSGGGEVGTAGRVASAVDEGVTRTTLHFVGPEASLHTGTQVDAPGREAPAGDTSTQAVQLESIPPPYSP